MLPKVAIISASDPNVVGGQERQTLAVALALSEALQFVLIAGEGTYAQAARKAGLQVIPIDMRSQGLDKAAVALRAVFIKERPDIVQTMEIRGNYLGRMASHTLSPRPKVLTVRHELMFSTFFSNAAKVRRFIYLLWDRFTAGRSDMFIAVAPVIARELISKEGISRERIRVIGNGLPKEFLSGVRDQGSSSLASKQYERNLNEAGQVLLFAGRLSSMKKADIAISAFAKIAPEVHGSVLLIVGDGPERRSLRHLAQETGLVERITFIAAVTDIRSFISKAAVLLHPSVHEATPMIIMEAMAMGTPVIAAAVGGVPGLIENGRTGRLVRPGSAEDMAIAAKEILSDPAKSSEIGSSARTHALKEFSEEKMIAGWRAAYDELLVEAVRK